jgi:RNA polymerase sigma-70 factor, ECF subfamily
LKSCDENEKATVEAACRGDVDAQAELYERHYAAMVWIAYSVLLDRGLAEDAAQQAFARAFEKLPRLRDKERFGPWLSAICRNAAQDMLRDRQRRADLQKVATCEICSDRNHNGFDRVVKEAVDSLPAMYREIIVLHYYTNMSYREIESVLDISGDKVKG